METHQSERGVRERTERRERREVERTYPDGIFEVWAEGEIDLAGHFVCRVILPPPGK